MDEFSPIEPLLFPGVFNNFADDQSYLNSLDSDTRAYVLRQMQEGSSIDDIREFVNKMQG